MMQLNCDVWVKFVDRIIWPVFRRSLSIFQSDFKEMAGNIVEYFAVVTMLHVKN
jgi:hypothetical protein